MLRMRNYKQIQENSSKLKKQMPFLIRDQKKVAKQLINLIPFFNQILFYIIKMIGLFILLCLTTSTFSIQVVVDYNKEPYTSLRDTLGQRAIENSDSCDDKLSHISVAKDPILNRNVFLYTLHVHGSYVDGDRCTGDYSRQRCETSVQGSSPTWMHGSKGKTFTYAWKLYLDPNFQVTGLFCHLHQIKLDGGGVGNPNLTLTARTDVQLQNEGNILAKVPLSSFKGTWIQIREKITYGPDGCIDFTAYRMKDGYLLMSHKGCGVKLDNNGDMIRPKFGFYRSLEKTTGLRNESVRIVDLCLGQGDSCHYDQNGNKHSPAPSLNLETEDLE